MKMPTQSLKKEKRDDSVSKEWKLDSGRISSGRKPTVKGNTAR